MKEFRGLARECLKPNEKKFLVDDQVCKLIAENCCYAPRPDEPAQPQATQS